MKKKWLSCLAIGFASCFAFGAVGCGEDQTGGGVGGEEQVYSTFKSAYQSTLNYTGAITMTGTYVEENSFGTDSNTDEAGITYSVNPQAGIGYYNEWDIDDGEREEDIYRIAKYNDGYVMQSYEKWDGEESTESYILSDVEYAAFAMSSWKDFSEIDFDELAAVADLDNFTSYKNALNEFNGMIAQKYQENEVDGSFSMTVSATTENGAQVITTVTQLNRKVEGQEMTMSQTTKMYAKGGKLTKFVMEEKQEMNYDGEKAVGTETMELALDYKFDQTGYDAAADKLDTTSTPQEKQESYLIGLDVDLYVNGVKVDTAYPSIYRYDTWESVANKLYSYSDVVEAYEIDTWYTDEACTKVFNPTEVIDFVGVDALYTKNATVKDGYALVFYRDPEELAFNTEVLYRIFGAMATYEADWDYTVYTSNGEYDLTQNWRYEDADKITVNGSVTESQSFAYEVGNQYFVEYVELITDEAVFGEFVGING
ncbi:MAG: hypothetical protein E7357_04920 [Clostridiales bacterium]|nr:hypothetical protein [Clostridiales bacterium]